MAKNFVRIQPYLKPYLLLCQPIIFAHVFLIIETSKVTPKAFSLLTSALQILTENCSLKVMRYAFLLSAKNEISSMTNFQAKKSWKDYKLSQCSKRKNSPTPLKKLFTEIPTKMNGPRSTCVVQIHFIAYCFTLFLWETFSWNIFNNLFYFNKILWKFHTVRKSGFLFI